MPLAVSFPKLLKKIVMKSLIENVILNTIEAFKKGEEFMICWNKVFEMKNAIREQIHLVFPNLTALVKAILRFPHSSAETKDIFSSGSK